MSAFRTDTSNSKTKSEEFPSIINYMWISKWHMCTPKNTQCQTMTDFLLQQLHLPQIKLWKFWITFMQSIMQLYAVFFKYITVHSAEKYLQRSPKQNKRDHPKTEINLMGMWKNIVISRSLVMYFDFSFI